jgi:hypothetical protein
MTRARHTPLRGVWVFRSTLPLKPFTGTLGAATDTKLAAMLQDLIGGGLTLPGGPG